MRDRLLVLAAVLVVGGLLLALAADRTGDRTAGWAVTGVLDGDTIEVRAPDGTAERVRLVGIDTPERGACGSAEAAAALDELVDDRAVALVPGAQEDRDRYDRLLRYVEVDGRDVGLALLEAGLAVARYDSRDGYGRHPREDAYVAADAAAAAPVCPTGAGTGSPVSPPAVPEAEPTPPAGDPAGDAAGPGSGPGGAWRDCAEARAHGSTPVHRGEPGYGRHLDGDDDGIGCEGG